VTRSAGLAACQARAAELQALFERIAATRMHGVPMLHPGLAVAAIGFEPEPNGTSACGVLVTPWFMNLVRLPLSDAPGADPVADRPGPLAVGTNARRAIGEHGFDFIGAHEPDFGPYEACSLFSPMFEFEDQAAAVATAQAVLDVLRRPPEPAAPAARADAAARSRSEPLPSRRALFFGRPTASPPSGR
jgi:[NiFe] hydrogenase assembly HybE family chaperone